MINKKNILNYFIFFLLGILVSILIFLQRDNLPFYSHLKLTVENVKCLTQKKISNKKGGCENSNYVINGCENDNCYSPNSLRNNNKYGLNQLPEDQAYLSNINNFKKKKYQNTDYNLSKILGLEDIIINKIDCDFKKKITTKCSIKFRDLPKIKFYLHSNLNEKIVFLVHGHFSNAKTIIGLNNLKDYNRDIGSDLIDKGYDVLSIEFIDKIETGSKINNLLYLNGTSLFGVYSKALCELSKFFNEKKIYIYGISNGGNLVNFFSNTCDVKNINLIFIDDIFSIGKYKYESLLDSKNKYLQTHSYLFQNNFYKFYDEIDLLINTKYKLHITSKKNLFNSYPKYKNCLEENNLKNNIFFSKKKINHHVSEKEIFFDSLNNIHPITKYSINPVCLKKTKYGY